MDENAPSETRARAWLDEVSYHFDPLRLTKRGTGPLAVRRLLREWGKVLAADRLGRLLGYYRGGEFYRRQTIYTWERPERGEHLSASHAMTETGRECYRRLLADLVQAATGGRFELVAHMGKRAWRFELVGQCAHCGRKFHPRRRTDRRCQRCIAKGLR